VSRFAAVLAKSLLRLELHAGLPPSGMENDEKLSGWIVKTNTDQVVEQALWAGLFPGMRAVDVGCGLNNDAHPKSGAAGGAFWGSTSGKRAGLRESIKQRADPRLPWDGTSGSLTSPRLCLVEYHYSNSSELVKNVPASSPGGHRSA